MYTGPYMDRNIKVPTKHMNHLIITYMYAAYYIDSKVLTSHCEIRKIKHYYGPVSYLAQNFSNRVVALYIQGHGWIHPFLPATILCLQTYVYLF